MTNLAHLLADLNSDDMSSYLAAKDQLAKCGQSAASSLISLMLVNGADHQNWRAAWRAATVLSEMGDRATIPAFVQALKSPNPMVRQTAAQALGERGDLTTVPHLIECLQDDHAIVLMWVIESLGNLHDRRAVEPLIALLARTEAQTLKYGIIKALGRIGDRRAAPVILQFIDSDDHHIRSRAREVYALLSDKSLGV